MALQLGALRDALEAAHVPADKAAAAAEEVAGYDNRLAALDSRVAVLTWMVGANLTLTLLIAGSVFAIWSKLGEVSGQLALLARSIH